MKIEVKYNIDFGKALKELEEKKLSETLNKEVTPETAKLPVSNKGFVPPFTLFSIVEGLIGGVTLPALINLLDDEAIFLFTTPVISSFEALLFSFFIKLLKYR